MTRSVVRLLSAGSVEPGLVRAVDAFSMASECEVRIEWATTPNIRRRLNGGESYDLVILTAEAAADLTVAGKLRDEPHLMIGSVGVGVAVRAHAPEPMIDSVQQLEQSLLQADRVIFTLATSGLYVESMLRREGVYDLLLPKIVRFETGPQMMDHLIHSAGDVVCMGAVVELRMFDGRGIRYVGALPERLQYRTAYLAARTVGTALPNEAAALARYLASAQGQAFLVACGVDTARATGA